MKNKTDEQLFILIQNGSELAFSILLKRYLNMATLLSKKFNYNLHEEIVQDAFIKVWKYAYKWNIKKGSVKTWIFVILKNTAYSYLKKENKFKNVKLEDNSSIIDFSDAFEKKQNSSEFNTKLFNNLTKKEYFAIIYKYYEDLSNISISERLNISTKAVESLLSRSKKKLKKVFK